MRRTGPPRPRARLGLLCGGWSTPPTVRVVTRSSECVQLVPAAVPPVGARWMPKTVRLACKAFGDTGPCSPVSSQISQTSRRARIDAPSARPVRRVGPATSREHWAECDRCHKWRLLAPGDVIPRSGDDFFCEHVQSSCATPADCDSDSDNDSDGVGEQSEEEDGGDDDTGNENAEPARRHRRREGRRRKLPCSPSCPGCDDGRGCEQGMGSLPFASRKKIVAFLRQYDACCAAHKSMPQPGERVTVAARAGRKKQEATVLAWYTTHVALRYSDGSRILVEKEHVKRKKYALSSEEWARYAYECNCYRGGARQLRYEIRRMRELTSSSPT